MRSCPKAAGGTGVSKGRMVDMGCHPLSEPSMGSSSLALVACISTILYGTENLGCHFDVPDACVSGELCKGTITYSPWLKDRTGIGEARAWPPEELAKPLGHFVDPWVS
eukprot:Protomagalhaensia_wolfi_Nauph_80__4418@NODE_4523_length_554_cov_346_438835_g3623_i0_p1_GENE_NODE_4523_length_554_cov_346_438835_g3623_i0NODE_4523_length_554_cov_346_438835_g3623_i0_p1_ORF_typecomplete_len109_score10_57_NODE_4523_length_554_cov_346_438835_g3623_i0179505